MWQGYACPGRQEEQLNHKLISLITTYSYYYTVTLKFKTKFVAYETAFQFSFLAYSYSGSRCADYLTYLSYRSSHYRSSHYRFYHYSRTTHPLLTLIVTKRVRFFWRLCSSHSPQSDQAPTSQSTTHLIHCSVMHSTAAEPDTSYPRVLNWYPVHANTTIYVMHVYTCTRKSRVVNILNIVVHMARSMLYVVCCIISPTKHDKT